MNAFHSIFKAVQRHGPKKTAIMLLTLGHAKVGTLVGTDHNGNEYYEDKNEVLGKDRWVFFGKWNFDPSTIPPEWHQWMHRMSDDTPDKLSKPFYVTQSGEHLTG